jgi:hypothetical protein
MLSVNVGLLVRIEQTKDRGEPVGYHEVDVTRRVYMRSPLQAYEFAVPSGALECHAGYLTRRRGRRRGYDNCAKDDTKTLHGLLDA